VELHVPTPHLKECRHLGVAAYTEMAQASPGRGGEAAARPLAGYRVCGTRLEGSPGAVGARLVGLVSVVPWMLLDGSI